MNKLSVYLIRWQISGFIMLIPFQIMNMIGIHDNTINMIIASFIGGLIFYPIDKSIFKKDCICKKTIQNAYIVAKN